MAENKNGEPDISDVIRVLRAAAGMGDVPLERIPTERISDEMPVDRVEFSAEARAKAMSGKARGAGISRNAENPFADSDEARNAIEIFRKMSGVSGEHVTKGEQVAKGENVQTEMPDKAEILRSAESSSADSDEARNALEIFRKMSGVSGEHVTKGEQAAKGENVQPEKPDKAEVPRNAESSFAESDEARSAIEVFRKMSGVVSGGQAPQSEQVNSGEHVTKSEQVTKGERVRTESPVNAEVSRSVENPRSVEGSSADSDEARSAIEVFRKMSGVTGGEQVAKGENVQPEMPDKADVEENRQDRGDSENLLRSQSSQAVEQGEENPDKTEEIPDSSDKPQNKSVSKKSEPQGMPTYKPFDITDIPKTVYTPPTEEEETEEPEKCRLAVCGADCADCGFGEEYDCPGCGGLWEDCDIVRCAAVKGHEHCGLCGEFPCDKLREAAFDPETGDNGDRLIRLKSLGEAAKDKRKPRLIMAGCCGGIALGAVIGGFSGAILPWVFAMTVTGAGAGLMAAVSGKGGVAGKKGGRQKEKGEEDE
ncbi:MAG: hypothetical protein NC078_04050 [Ruminococcus sp.]|nr:hypothetical protein [Ruminococcus sp.]